jgi:hypothetical protein
MVSISGLIQRPDVDFCAIPDDGGSLRFTSPPPRNSQISVYSYRYSPYVLNPPIVTQYVSDGSQSLYPVQASGGFNGTNACKYTVVISGLIQRPELDYCAVEDNYGSICLSSPAPVGAPVSIYAYKFGNLVYSVAGKLGDVRLCVNDIIGLQTNLNSKLTVCDVRSFSTPVTASGDFMVVSSCGVQRLIRLWDNDELS